MIVRKNIDLDAPLTNEEKKMLKMAPANPVEFDADCPELTTEELKEFRRVSDTRKEERRKQTVTVRISPQALSKAKSLGKGYTSVLSRILEMALNDSDIIKKCL